jgi:hypothetical protein
VRGYDIGRVPLPRVRLAAYAAGTIDTLEFPPDTLYVDSLTPAMSGSVEPDRGPVPTELRPTDYVVEIVGALLAIAGIVVAVWFYRRAKRRSQTAGEAALAPEPPEVVFLRSIESLRAEVGSLSRDRFYDRLSLAIRVYVAAVTGVPALDRTTGELERELLARARRSMELLRLRGGFARGRMSRSQPPRHPGRRGSRCDSRSLGGSSFSCRGRSWRFF